MELALYDPRFGYYARAGQRSGRAGDFFTSVDVGPLFGELLERQIAEMAGHLPSPDNIDIVEAGAGNGRLSADILRAAERTHPELLSRIALSLVEASEAARNSQRSTLGDHAGSLVYSNSALPDRFEGILFANELLDAMPVHQVVMREDGLKEVFVVADTSLRTIEGPPSTPALAAHLSGLDVTLEPGWRVEIGVCAREWMREAARRLVRGFIIIIDYGHPASELYSVTHSSGTLTSFARHVEGGDAAGLPGWLQRPGEQDITAHVDFTSVQNAAHEEGMTTLGFLDQTYFLMGIIQGSQGSQGSLMEMTLRDRLAFKTLTMPGGMGSVFKVLILGKNVGTPSLVGCSFRQRVT
jgi:SAM-dependent MidA family methyltransferase